MATFAKPENALKRAEELIQVGQKQAALQALHDLIASKRYRTWQKTLEKIMMKYIELCVDMRKGRFAKDGLIQYRIVCQQVNVSSLEEVIKYFLKLSSEKLDQVQSQIQAAELTLDVDDLEAEKSPEDLMVSYVSGEKGKERADRELITPWFKFLWETIRSVLEILRNNSKLEALYAMTAHKAFQFCLQYKRNTEFRRLCEIIRNHLANLNKYKDQRDRPDLSQPETLQFYLETRFEQLKVATELELWQEAFRSVEDIFNLMSLVKKVPKPQMMAIYYSKLTQIFWISENYLFHAYAWFKLYNLQKNFNRTLKEKDLQAMASSVVLSVLSIPPIDSKHGASHFEAEIEKDRNFRMNNLLSFNFDTSRESRETLSRSSLIQELITKGLLNFSFPEVKEIYSLLEIEFHPLDLANKAILILSRISSIKEKLSASSPIPEVSLDQYIPSLQKLTALRLLKQVSSVYDTIGIKNFCSMIPFFSFSQVEKIITDAAKFNYLRLKINHQDSTICFGYYDLESDGIKNHLVVIAQKLNKAVSLINAKSNIPRKTRTVTNFSELNVTIQKEHERLLSRKVLIERRKEEAEKQILEKEREEATIRLKLQKQTEELEAKRLAQELARRKEERIKREIEEKEREDAKKLMEELEKKKGKKGKKIIDADAGKITKKQLVEDLLSEQMKEKQEKEKKISKLAKQMDHLERAKREEERPLIEAAFKAHLIDSEQYHETQYSLLVETSNKQHSLDVTEKSRLSRMVVDKEEFRTLVMNRRKGEFEKLKKEREEKLAELREMKRSERIRLRKIECYQREELKRIQEEAELKKKQEEERLKKLEEIAEIQRKREMEAEEKAKREREALLAASELPKTQASGGPKFVPSALRRGVDAQPKSVADERPALWRSSEGPRTGTTAPPGDDKWTRVGMDRERERERPRFESRDAPAPRYSTFSTDRDSDRERPQSTAFGDRDKDRVRSYNAPPARSGGYEAPDRERPSFSRDRFGDRSSGDHWGTSRRPDTYGGSRDRDSGYGGFGGGEKDSERDRQDGAKEAPRPSRPNAFVPPHLRKGSAPS